MIIWLRTAKQNLAEELIFIRKEDPNVAKRIARLVKDSVDNLESFPEMGRMGRIKGTRELVFSKIPYIIPYRIKDGNIEILRFFHASRKLPKKW